MSQFYVYEHLRKDINLPFYVGKGSGYRKNSKENRNKHWHHIVEKHGFIVNVIAKNLDEELAFLCEQERIDQLRRLGINLCNYTDGGEGISGHKHSEKTKEKLRSMAIGRHVGHTFNVGRKQSEEWKKNISKSLIGNQRRLGVPHTNEVKKRISESVSGKNNPMYGKVGATSGKIRITNGVENKVISPNDVIPEGWYKGMMTKRSKK